MSREPGAALRGAEIVVPGSTSNLGPGFDAIGLALDVWLRLRVVGPREDGREGVDWQFVDGRPDGENALDRGLRAGLAIFAPEPGRGWHGKAGCPPFVVEVRSDIPVRAGLGSSAAALVAGLRLAEVVAGPQPVEALLTAACALEGHPDNTSASLLGGLVVACREDDGRVTARAAAWPDDWPLIVATPALTLETKVARAALPPTVPHRDAVFNVQRAAMLVHAVHLRDAALMRAALADRLHQPYRAPLVPGLADALTWRDEGLLGIYLSGGGPSLAAIVDARVAGAAAHVTRRFEMLYRDLGLAATVRQLRGVGGAPTSLAGRRR